MRNKSDEFGKRIWQRYAPEMLNDDDSTWEYEDMSELGLILELILKLLPIIKPSDLDKIKDAIEKREKEIHEQKQKIIQAVASGDIDTINALLFGE